MYQLIAVVLLLASSAIQAKHYLVETKEEIQPLPGHRDIPSPNGEDYGLLEDLVTGAGEAAQKLAPLAKTIDDIAGPLLDGVGEAGKPVIDLIGKLIGSILNKDDSKSNKKSKGTTPESVDNTEDDTEMVTTKVKVLKTTQKTASTVKTTMKSTTKAAKGTTTSADPQ